MKAIPQQNFQKKFQKWQRRWVKSAASQGGYFGNWSLSVWRV